MADVIRDFWWLAFPLGWALWSMWDGWLKSRARAEELKLIAAYTAAGREPPAELLKALGGQRGEN
jgi:hypothetical protein